MRFATAALLAALLCAPALGHDRHGQPNWIYKENRISPVDGSHSCGLHDCMELPDEIVKETAGGYRVEGDVTYSVGPGAITFTVNEVVPHREVQTSRDGKYWRCHKPDKSRRCFFAPPPAM